MMSFRGARLRDSAIPAGSVWLMTEIAELKGRQDIYAKQAPQLLKALREAALIQSVESSNRDFLCIHPFRDGNGRVSRLLTLLALYHHGLEVGRYISLERLVEESKDDYYAVLQRSSERWHEGGHDLLPWLNYFLTVVRRAYREFEERAGQVKSPRGAKTALVRAAIEAFTSEFTLADIERSCPGVSRDMIRRLLRELQRTAQVECVGRGPGAPWRKKEGNTLKRG